MYHVLLGRAQPVIPPNLYVNEHNSLGSSGKSRCDPHGRFTTGGAAHSCAAGHTTYDNKYLGH